MLRIYIEKMERERERLGLSMTELEKRAKLKRSLYSKIITRGSTTLKTLTKIADALYMDAKDLLTN